MAGPDQRSILLLVATLGALASTLYLMRDDGEETSSAAQPETVHSPADRGALTDGASEAGADWNRGLSQATGGPTENPREVPDPALSPRPRSHSLLVRRAEKFDTASGSAADRLRLAVGSIVVLMDSAGTSQQLVGPGPHPNPPDDLAPQEHGFVHDGRLYRFQNAEFPVYRELVARTHESQSGLATMTDEQVTVELETLLGTALSIVESAR